MGERSLVASDTPGRAPDDLLIVSDWRNIWHRDPAMARQILRKILPEKVGSSSSPVSHSVPLHRSHTPVDRAHTRFSAAPSPSLEDHGVGRTATGSMHLNYTRNVTPDDRTIGPPFPGFPRGKAGHECVYTTSLPGAPLMGAPLQAGGRRAGPNRQCGHRRHLEARSRPLRTRKRFSYSELMPSC